MSKHLPDPEVLVARVESLESRLAALEARQAPVPSPAAEALRMKAVELYGMQGFYSEANACIDAANQIERGERNQRSFWDWLGWFLS